MSDWRQWIRPEKGLEPRRGEMPVAGWWTERRAWWAGMALQAWYAATVEDSERDERSLVNRIRATAILRYEAWGGIDEQLTVGGRKPVGEVPWPGSSWDSVEASKVTWKAWPSVAREYLEEQATLAANAAALHLYPVRGVAGPGLKKVVYMTETDIGHVEAISRKGEG